MNKLLLEWHLWRLSRRLQRRDKTGENRNRGELTPKIIYVQVSVNGIDFWKPVRAWSIVPSVYLISSDQAYDPDAEAWQYLPGETVVCECKQCGDGDRMVAVNKLERLF